MEYFLLVAFGLTIILIIYLFSTVQKANNVILPINNIDINTVKREYNDIINLYQASCCIKVRYGKGISQLPEYQNCYLLADNDKLSIITEDIPVITILLNLSKITYFNIINAEDFFGQFTSTYTNAKNIVLQSTSSITIRYIDDIGVNKQISFSMNSTPELTAFNNFALTQCNIKDFVNIRIKQQENTIIL